VVRSRSLWLVLLTMLPVLGEVLALRTTGFTSALGLAPQLTAPSPFGMFHDVRWVQVYHNSWWAFAIESAAAIVLRSLFNTGAVVLAGGAGGERTWLAVLRLNLLFNLLAYVVLSPWAAVAVGASDTSLSWFVLGEILPFAFLSLVLQRGAVRPDWWRTLPSLREAIASIVTMIVLTVDALVIYSAPGWLQAPVGAAAGAANALLWRRLVRAACVARPHRHNVPAAPVAIVITAAALLAMGQFSSIGGAIAEQAPGHLDNLGRAGLREQLMYVAGYDSALDPNTVRADTPDSPIVHFSYLGLAANGTPLPYRPPATRQSLMTSAARLADQVRNAHQRSGRPIALVAQSEGTLVVRSYLARYPHADVDGVVLLSPLLRPGRVYFPPPRDGSGWGIATGWLLREMFAAVRDTSHSQVSPDEPFVRSILDNAPAYRGTMLCAVPGLRVIAFVPFSEALVSPPQRFGADIPVVELPGLHAGLLGEPDVQAHIVAFLRGQAAGTSPGPGYAVIQRAAGAWQAPALALGVNPAWHADHLPDPTFGQSPC
jgi:hypothetical protein